MPICICLDCDEECDVACPLCDDEELWASLSRDLIEAE